MTKEVKTILYDTLQGGSSVFSMGFDSEQLSWVKGVCKTLETSCNEYADACNKYVNTASETIQKFCGEVFESKDPSDSEEPEPDNLKNDALTDDLTELSEDHAENTSKPSDCGQEQPTVTATEGSSLGMLSDLQGQNPGFACTSSDDEDQVPSRAERCSDNAEESSNEETADAEEICDGKIAEESCNGKSSSLGADESCSEKSSSLGAKESCNEKSSSLGAEERCNEKTAETVSSSADVMGSPSEDDSPLGTSSQYRGSLTVSGCPPPVKVKVADKAEVSKGREGSTSSMTDILINSSQTGEFEAITVEEFVEEAINNKIALNSYCSSRSMSLKKKLKNAFLPRKRFELVNHRDQISELAMQIRQKPPSSGPCESIESEWELL